MGGDLTEDGVSFRGYRILRKLGIGKTPAVAPIGRSLGFAVLGALILALGVGCLYLRLAARQRQIPL